MPGVLQMKASNPPSENFSTCERMMIMSKILKRILILALIIVGVSFIGGAGDFLMTLLIPPRIYIVIGLLILFVLLKILYELKNKKDD